MREQQRRLNVGRVPRGAATRLPSAGDLEASTAPGSTTPILATVPGLGRGFLAAAVDNTRQTDFLRRAQCDKLPGQLLSSALPATEAKRLLPQSGI